MAGTGDREAEKAAREAAWWARWWAEDFSWEGLGKRPWVGVPTHRWIGWSVTPEGQCVETQSAPDGSRPASLQDYFRWDPDTKRLRPDEDLFSAGLLITRLGQPDFHILHLPQAYEDGAATFKAELDAGAWAKLETEISRLLSRSGPTDKAIGDENCASPDLRAQLTGAILRVFPRPPAPENTLHLAAALSAFLTKADALGLEFGSPTVFSGAHFCSEAGFSHAQFSGGNADFFKAEFAGGGANFFNTKFSGGNANFFQAQFYGGDTSFSGAQFSGGYADFSIAEFSDGDASFLTTKFSGGDAIFRRTQLSGGRTSFIKAEFSSGNADFSDSEFSGGHADFSNAQFSGGNATFSGAEFSGGNAKFLSASFSNEASFSGVRFLRSCEFGRSDQPHTKKPGLGAQFDGRLNLRGAYFKRLAGFSRVRFPDKAEDRNSAFEGARFFEPLDLKGVEHLPFSAFHGVRLDKGLLLDSQHPVPEQFEQALKDAEAAIKRDEKRRPNDPGHDAERSGADARYAALEAGCRALKEAMAADGDRKREQSFFSHELAARERRVRHRLEQLKAGPASLGSRLKALSVRAELTASQAYRFFSGYGGSILRPLVTLLASFIVAAIALGLLTCVFALAGNEQLSDVCFGLECGPTMHPIVSNTLEAAFRGMLGPFRLLAGPGQPFAYLGDSAPVFRSLVGTVMLLHGLASSALIFLWLLALRRQFQIS